MSPWRFAGGTVLAVAAALTTTTKAAGPVARDEATSPAPPDQTERARQAAAHFDRALTLLDEQAYEQAAAELERAYQLSPHHAVLFNLGQAYAALGRPVAAVETLERYREQAGATLTDARKREVAEQLGRQRARIAELTVEAPAGAAIRVDNRIVGNAPLPAPLRLALGEHVVEASLTGHTSAQQTLTLAGLDHRSVRLDPVPAEPVPGPQGSLFVSCQTPAVLVTVDGRPVGRTPFPTALALRTGPHRIGFARTGYRGRERPVDVGEGAAARIDCALAPLERLPPGVSGTLVVAASEPGAAVRVDGRLLAADGKLPAGAHVVEIQRDGFEPWRREIHLAAGRTETLRAVLTATPPYAEAYETRARAHRHWAYGLGAVGLAMGAAALGLFLYDDARYGDWEREKGALDEIYQQPPPHSPTVGERQRANDERLLSIQSFDRVSLGLAIGAGALCAGAVIAFVSGDPPGRYQVGIAPVTGGATGGFATRW